MRKKNPTCLAHRFDAKCGVATVSGQALLGPCRRGDGSKSSTRKISKKARLAAVRCHVAEIASHIRIRKSTIKCASAGAFVKMDVPAGLCIGFYEGRRVSAAESAETPTALRDYFLLDARTRHDARDPQGRLQIEDGSVVDVHDWDDAQWAALEQDGVAWIGIDANWTRFMNHASAKYRNVCLATTSEKYGRSRAMYASRPIKAGEELFFDCATRRGNQGGGGILRTDRTAVACTDGKEYFEVRNYEPADPEVSAGVHLSFERLLALPIFHTRSLPTYPSAYPGFLAQHARYNLRKHEA